MPDVKVRDNETGRERILPKAVAQMNRRRFVIISEEKDTIKRPALTYAPGTEPKQAAPNPPAPKMEQKREDVGAESKLEELRKQYEEKTGTKPHHRMKEDSLIKAIKE